MLFRSQLFSQSSEAIGDDQFLCKLFLKTVYFGKEINFFRPRGFFEFSIRIQWYKERKILGSIWKVMINYSIKDQKRFANPRVSYFHRSFSHFSKSIFGIFSDSKVFVCMSTFLCQKIKQITLSIFRDAHLNVDIGQICIAEFCF